MNKLTNKELFNVDGGAIIRTPFDWICNIYRTIKIKLLMKKLFVDWLSQSKKEGVFEKYNLFRLLFI